MEGGDHQRRRHPLARDVAQHQADPAVLAAEEVVVVAAHLPRRAVPADQLVPRHHRRPLGEDLALDLGRQVHLALQALLFERLEVEPGVLQRQRRLVGEQREGAAVRGEEGADAPAALLVAHRDQPAGAALDLDRHAEQVARPGQQVRRGLPAAGQEAAQLGVVAQQPGRRLAAEGAVQAVAAVLQDVEGAAAGVEQRHGAQQDLLREAVEVEGRGHRQPHVVEGLELDHPVVDLELLLLELLLQPAALERRGEQQGQRIVGRRLIGATGRGEEEPPARELEAAEAVGRDAPLDHQREMGAHRGLLLQRAAALQVEAGGVRAVLAAPEVEQPLQHLALARLVAGEGEQLVPGVRHRAGARHALHGCLL